MQVSLIPLRDVRGLAALTGPLFLLECGMAVRQVHLASRGGNGSREFWPQYRCLAPRIIRIVDGLSSYWRQPDERVEHIIEEI